MKTFLLFALAICCYSTFTYGQCTPEVSATQNGPFPETLIFSYINMENEETLTLVFPSDTVFAGFTVPKDSITIVDVMNLPQGVEYLCENTLCSAYSSPASQKIRTCLHFYGTAEDYCDSIKIAVQTHITFLGSPISLDDTLNVVFLVTDPLGIEDQVSSQITVYPNPASEKLTILSSAQEKEITYLLCDTKGQLIRRGRTTKDVSLEGLTPGMYILNFPETSSRIRFIKE